MIYGLGHLLKNPQNPSDADFFWDPRLEPWKVDPDGKIYFHTKYFNLVFAIFIRIQKLLGLIVLYA